MEANEYYIEFLNACKKHYKKDPTKYFKKYDPELPRIVKIIGYTKSINPDTILDIGIGRGRLFWPLAYNFPNSKILGIDKEWYGIERIKCVNKEIKRIDGACKDITNCNLKINHFDVVIASEVLEHISNVEKAIENMILVSKKHIIGSCPNKRDDNPDHINFFTPQILNILFTDICKKNNIDIKKIQFEYTLKELLFFITLNK